MPTIEMVGLDVVAPRLRYASERGYVRTLCGSATAIPASDGTFDAVVAGEVLEHLTKDDAEVAICEFARVLRPGRRLLLTTPNPLGPRSILQGESTLGTLHLSAHSPKQLKRLLEASGYRHVHFSGSGRMTRHIGERWPFLSLYGSYLACADRG